MKKSVVYTIITILVLLLATLAFLIYYQHSQMTEIVEQMQIEKDELQEEYEDLAIQFDGYQQLDIRNDSLQDLLSREQQRVQDLLEELRVTKITNARRIAELKKELATVRMVMQDYVRQVDSLNATNKRLTVENQKVRAENQQVRTRNEELTQANTVLTETVSRASMLEVTSCTPVTLNKNDKKTRMASHIRKLQFDYVLAKNITCTPGWKELYARVMDPQGNLLGESEDKLFSFENQEIAYTLVQQLEYTGEAYNGTCYCPLGENEGVQSGFYTIDFFCDGNLIGSFPFQIKK